MKKPETVQFSESITIKELDPLIHENPAFLLQIWNAPAVLDPDEADRLSNTMKNWASKTRQQWLTHFWTQYNTWESNVDNLQGYGDSLPKFTRQISLFWKWLTPQQKDRIRRKFDVREYFNPPSVNLL